MTNPAPAPSTEALARYAEEFNQSASMRHFGLRLSFPEGTRARVSLDPVKREHLGGLGTDAVNGGVLAAMFDLAIGCTPALVDPKRRTATMQLSMTFMRPVRGEHIWAEAHVEHAGGSTLFARCTIFDAEGNACAKCDGVVKLSKLTWQSGHSPAVN